MSTGQRKLLGYCIILAGAVMAPLLPFAALIIIPLAAVWLGIPIAALLFAMLLDSFLVPGGTAPLWTSLTVYTLISIPFFDRLRYTAP